MAANRDRTDREWAERLFAILATVPDPEIPVINIVELGIVRGVERQEDGRVLVVVTPTYTGCPATLAIRNSIRHVLDQAGHADIAIATRIAPAWSTDWISDSGRAKLQEYGIAPPARGAGRASLHADREVRCPRCGSPGTEEVSRFGSTPCKALRRCLSCLEPFDQFKCH